MAEIPSYPARGRSASGRGGAVPWRAVRLLVLLSGTAFLFAWAVRGDYAGLAREVGVSADGLLAGRVWQPICFVVLSASVFDLLAAIAMLLAFGRAVERAVGPARLVAAFLLTALGAAAAHVGMGLLLLPGDVPLNGPLVLGFAAVSCYLLLFPDARFLGSVETRWVFLSTSLASLALVLALSASPEIAGRTSHLAHLSGLILGAPALALVLGAFAAVERWRTSREIRTLEEEVEVRAQVENLLEKISRDGIGVLTWKERRFLDSASRRFYRRRGPRDPEAGEGSRPREAAL